MDHRRRLGCCFSYCHSDHHLCPATFLLLFRFVAFSVASAGHKRTRVSPLAPHPHPTRLEPPRCVWVPRELAGPCSLFFLLLLFFFFLLRPRRFGVQPIPECSVKFPPWLPEDLAELVGVLCSCDKTTLRPEDVTVDRVIARLEAHPLAFVRLSRCLEEGNRTTRTSTSTSTTNNRTSTSTSTSSSGGGAWMGGDGVESALLAHLECLKLFNAMVAACLPLLDLSSGTVPGTLAHALVSGGAARLVWPSVKTSLWEQALSASKTGGTTASAEFHVTHRGPRELATRPWRSDRLVLATVFGQIFANVDPVPPQKLRLQDPELRVWKVRLSGQSSFVDAVGPYRESLTDAVKELHLPSLSLFVPCCNQQAARSGIAGTSSSSPTSSSSSSSSALLTLSNRRKFLPCPTATRPLQLRMFAFAGKLMGVAMRTQTALPFPLPPLFWRRLCGHAVTREDLKGVDSLFVETLEEMERAALSQPRPLPSSSFFSSSSSSSSLSSSSPQTFEEQSGGRTFVTRSVTGSEVELGPEGKRRPVTLANASEFVARALDFHCHEFDEQIAHVAAGLAIVVPLAPLRLFTAHQLEALVCGNLAMDLNLLKAKTTYHGGFQKHPTIALFWEMLEKMSDLEKSELLEFASGLQRLPLRPQDFERKFNIVLAQGGNEASPRGHSESFAIELPEYTDLAVMVQKLKGAVVSASAASR